MKLKDIEGSLVGWKRKLELFYMYMLACTKRNYLQVVEMYIPFMCGTQTFA